MKKNIIFMSIIASLINFAGPKADLEEANKLINDNKINDAIKVLEASKPVKGEEKEFEQINFSLAMHYINQNQDEKAKIYLDKISDDINSKTEIAKQVDSILIRSTNNEKEKIKYLERLSSRFDNKDLDILATLNAAYVLANETKESSLLLSNAKKENLDLDWLNFLTGQNLINLNFDKAKIYLNKALDSKNNVIKSEVHFLLARYYYLKKEDKKAETEIEQAIKIDGKNANLLARIAEVYKRLGDEKLNYKYLNDAYKADPQDIRIVINLIMSSYNLNDKKEQNKWYGIARNINKDINNATLTNIFYVNATHEMEEGNIELAKQEFGLAKEYGMKAFNEGNKEVNFILLILSISDYDKVNAEKFANEIMKTGTKEEKEKVKPILENINLTLAETAYQNEDYAKAKEFALAANKKNHDADLLLATLYFRSNELNLAKKYAKLSIDNNVHVQEAKRLLEEIEKIK